MKEVCERKEERGYKEEREGRKEGGFPKILKEAVYCTFKGIDHSHIPE